MSATFLLTQAQTLWKLLVHLGYDPKPLYAEEGLAFSDLENTSARVPHRVMDRLWKRAEEFVDDPCFGLDAGAVWHPSHSHVLGYAWLAMPSLKDGIEFFIRHKEVLSERTQHDLEYNHNGLKLILSDAMKSPNQMDQVLALCMQLCRMNYGEDLMPVEVTLMHPPLGCSEKYEAVLGKNIKFNAEMDSLTLSMRDVERPLITGNQMIVGLHEKLVEKLAREVKGDNIVDRVSHAVTQFLASGDYSRERVAEELHISPRSMHRHLEKAGTSYSEILRRVRQELVIEYMKEPHLTLAEIAFLLGYSEYSAFSRAYKRWTGLSPKGLRE